MFRGTPCIITHAPNTYEKYYITMIRPFEQSTSSLSTVISINLSGSPTSRWRCASLFSLGRNQHHRSTIGGVRYFPKCIFLRANSQVSISQVETSKMCNFPCGNFPLVRLGPLSRSRLHLGPSAAARMG